LGEDLVNVVVNNGKRYWIHRQLLCRRSEYFDRLFNGGFRESTDETMHKPDVDPRTFDVFVHWLYTQELPRDFQLPGEPDKPLRFLHLLYLADEVLIPSLQVQCYARIRSDFGENKFPSRAFIQQLYERDLGVNHLRTYIAKLCVYFIFHGNGHGKDWDEICRANPDFATDIAVEMRRVHGKSETPQFCSQSYLCETEKAYLSYVHLPRYPHPFRLAEFDKYPAEKFDDSIRCRLSERDEEMVEISTRTISRREKDTASGRRVRTKRSHVGSS
jgi:hypothetical protein